MWSFKDCLYSLLYIVIIFGCIYLLSYYYNTYIHNIFNYIGLSQSIKLLILFLLQELIILFSMLIVIYNYNINYKHSFKLKWVGIWKTIKYVIGSYILFIIIMLFIQIISILTNVNIPGIGKQENILQLFGSGFINITIAFVIIVFIGPIIEEIFFRGYILQGAIHTFGKNIGNLITAFIFGIIHLEFQVFIPLFILGIIINNIFIKTNSLYPAIIFHVCNNCITFSVLYLYAN